MLFTILHISPPYFDLSWAIINLMLVVLWLPFAYWLIKKFNRQNLTSPIWRALAVDSSLTHASVSRPLDNSLDFLNEIRQFEKSEENRLPVQ